MLNQKGEAVVEVHFERFIQENPPVKGWFEWLKKKNEKTAGTYLKVFYHYFEGLKEEKKFTNVGALLEDHKIAKKNDDEYRHNDFLKSYLFDTDVGTKTESYRRQVLSAVRSFYEFNRLPLVKEKVDLRTKNDKVLTEQKLSRKGMSLEEVKTLVNYMKIREKAISLMLMSSGMGMNEFLEFNECHCDPEYVKKKGHYCISVRTMQQLEKINRGEQEPIIKIEFPARKSNANPYYTFIGKDAIDHFNLYLKCRKQLVEENPRLKGENLTPEWQEGQPFFISNFGNAYSDKDYRSAIQNYKKQLGFGGRQLTPHNFRDVFKTLCSHAGVDDKISEFFIGHSLDSYGYNQLASMFPEDIVKEYKKVEPELNFISKGRATTKELKELQQKVEVDAERISELNRSVFKREDIIERLLENERTKESQIQALTKNGEAKERRITELSEQIQKIKTQMEMTSDTLKWVLKNVLERLMKFVPEDEGLKELYEALRVKAKEA